MRLIDADRLLTDRMKSKYYHLPNGDTAIPLIDIEHAPTIEPQQRWIPCSERLPEEHGYYLVQTDGSHNDVIDIAEYGMYKKLVWGWNKASEVIAWMPLPEPYEKEGDDK